MTIWRMRISRKVPKSTNTHSEYVLVIDLQLQQQLHERVSIVRCTYSACLVILLSWI